MERNNKNPRLRIEGSYNTTHNDNFNKLLINSQQPVPRHISYYLQKMFCRKKNHPDDAQQNS